LPVRDKTLVLLIKNTSVLAQEHLCFYVDGIERGGDGKRPLQVSDVMDIGAGGENGRFLSSQIKQQPLKHACTAITKMVS
jgi:hypothetical protein